MQVTVTFSHRFVFTSTALVFVGKPSFDDWKELGPFLSRIQRTSLLWLGDWLNFGERRWGERYAQALGETDFNYQTLRDAKWVALKTAQIRGAVPSRLSSREDEHSFAKYKAIAPLDPASQKAWLHYADSENLSSRQLSKHIQASKLLGKPKPPSPFKSTITFRIAFRRQPIMELKEKITEIIKRLAQGHQAYWEASVKWEDGGPSIVFLLEEQEIIKDIMAAIAEDG